MLVDEGERLSCGSRCFLVQEGWVFSNCVSAGGTNFYFPNKCVSVGLGSSLGLYGVGSWAYKLFRLIVRIYVLFLFV